MRTNEDESPVDMAVDAVGSITELARRLGVLPQTIVNWRKRGIPVEQVPEVEAATIPRDEHDKPVEGAEPRVHRSQLRPDMPKLFPPVERAAA